MHALITRRNIHELYTRMSFMNYRVVFNAQVWELPGNNVLIRMWGTGSKMCHMHYIERLLGSIHVEQRTILHCVIYWAAYIYNRGPHLHIALCYLLGSVHI